LVNIYKGTGDAPVFITSAMNLTLRKPAGNSTIIVGIDGLATIECPGCGTIKASHVDAFLGRSNLVTVFCHCGLAFQVNLDFRNAERLEVNFNGYYSKLSSLNWGYMKVINISLGGLGLFLVGRNEVDVGDELQVEFTLDDFPPSVVKKRVEVRSIKGNALGCKFINSLGSNDPLTHYLLS